MGRRRVPGHRRLAARQVLRGPGGPDSRLQGGQVYTASCIQPAIFHYIEVYYNCTQKHNA